jgi:ATP phosphoribosyltransferase
VGGPGQAREDGGDGDAAAIGHRGRGQSWTQNERAEKGAQGCRRPAAQGCNSPTISHLSDPDWVALEIVADESDVKRLIPALHRAGAQGIIEYPLNKIIL